MIGLSISPLYIGLHALLLVALSLLVVRGRFKYHVDIGTGGNDTFERIARVQMNFTEYVPLALLALVVVELSGYSAMVIHGLGLTLLIARVLHAWGLNKSAGTTLQRFLGTALTWGVLIVEAGMLVCRYTWG